MDKILRNIRDCVIAQSKNRKVPNSGLKNTDTRYEFISKEKRIK